MWLHRRIDDWYRASRRRVPGRPAPRRLTVEALEERTLLSFSAPATLPDTDVAGAVGDFNGDGRADILTNTATLLGNADGTFQTLPRTAWGGTVGDFNRDGKLDVVALGTDRVSVFLGNGDGTFQAPRDTVMPSFGKGKSKEHYQPNAAAVGDLDNDGVPDLVVTAEGEQVGGCIFGCTTKTYVLTLPGNGDGSFRTGEAKAKGGKNARLAPILLGEGVLNASPVSLGDFTGDGVPDVLAVDYQSSPSGFGAQVYLLPGVGTGALGKPKLVAETARVFALPVADLNGDGKLDFLTHPGASIGVHLGNGNGTFQPPRSFDAGGEPWSVALADVNGDGRLDAVTANPGTDNVSVLLGEGDGTFQAALTFAVGPQPGGVKPGDFNGDGHADLVVNHHRVFGSPADPFVSVLFNDGGWPAGGFSADGIGDKPDDPALSKQWGLKAVDARKAWGITTGSMSVVVSVIDHGIDYTHEDLYLNIWLNQGEIPDSVRPLLVDVDHDGLITFRDLNDPINQGPGKITDLNGTGYIDGGDLLRPLAEGGWADGVDNGGNGYVDDLVGWDFGENDNDPLGPPHHGTLVAGVIGAIGDNDVGIAGVNWQVQLMASKIVDDDGLYVLGAAPAAITYSADNGARVSNNSYGADPTDLPASEFEATYDAIAYAATRDHLFVGSAGNQSRDADVLPRLPAGFDLPNIISVAATDPKDRLTAFSNVGSVSVDLGAPGIQILTTAPANGYASVAGTSFSAPHVAGAAALILSINPNLSYAEVKALILGNVDPVTDLAGKTVSGGRLNLFKALSATPPPAAPPSGAGDSPASGGGAWSGAHGHGEGVVAEAFVPDSIKVGTAVRPAGRALALDRGFVAPTLPDAVFTAAGEQDRTDFWTGRHGIGHPPGPGSADNGLLSEPREAGGWPQPLPTPSASPGGPLDGPDVSFFALDAVAAAILLGGQQGQKG